VLARFYRDIEQREVFFNTGTDEHGQKIFEAAQKAGKDEQDYVDHYAGEVEKLGEALGLSDHAFIRTTNEPHIKAAQELWNRCNAKGDIEKRTYKGLYCIGCEKYLTQKDLVDGKCPLHPGQDPKEVEEENYFFKLSKYQKQLEEYLSNPEVITPEYHRLEALEFVKNGLEDFSISREKSQLSWGVPVPGDDTQVMYVWFDALTNYISTLGWPDTEGNFKKFWVDGETLQVAGKDQVRFQSIMWQAMLTSADIKTTDKVFYHGFINSGGQRMSKSLGNVISPFELVKRYGTEATRYLLLRHVHPTDDTDITWERLDEWYTADLVNGLGNLASRILTLAEKNLPGPITSLEESNLRLGKLFDAFRFDLGLEVIWTAIQRLDKDITTSEPFKVVKDNKEKGSQLIVEEVKGLYEIALLLSVFMPETSEKILKAIQENKKPENLFPRLG
jgi:methionyl-tRNA synthetase